MIVTSEREISMFPDKLTVRGMKYRTLIIIIIIYMEYHTTWKVLQSET